MHIIELYAMLNFIRHCLHRPLVNVNKIRLPLLEEVGDSANGRPDIGLLIAITQALWTNNEKE